MTPKTIAIIILLISIANSPSLAFETDQYNLPPAPLADIGDEVAEYTRDNLLVAINKINVRISAAQACLENTVEKNSKCENAETLKERLGYLRSEEAIAREVFKQLGAGFVAFAKAGDWMNSHKFRSQPARYKTSYRDSIYVWMPANYFTISPTVNIYGVQLGTDKIAHFFQQGYTYHRIAERQLANGSSVPDAESKAVAWGRMTENTYYGTLVGGVFSNADLFSNFAGMKFYEGLTKETKIGDLVRPATLQLENGLWKLNAAGASDEVLLRPFITDHLNEALNPSLYIPGLRSSVRGIVKKRSCPQWLAAYPSRSRQVFQSLTDSLQLWNGQNYGHKQSEKLVSIANTCFANSVITGDIQTN